jgi:hypothetical protein
MGGAAGMLNEHPICIPTLTYQKYKKKVKNATIAFARIGLHFALNIGSISAQSHMLLTLNMYYFSVTLCRRITHNVAIVPTILSKLNAVVTG